MFEWVDKHKRWIQIILLILIVPSFAFFGINYYFQEYGSSGAVAKVAGSKISPQEFEQALRKRQEDLRKMMEGKVDQAMLDSNEVRNSVINGLVDQRALLAHAMHAGITVTDDQLHKHITQIPDFADTGTGKFSEERYKQLLRASDYGNPVVFEAERRRMLLMSQVRDTVADSAMVSMAVVDRLGRIREQQREVSQWLLTPDQVRSKVNITDDDVKKYYEAHKDEFRIPERARVEYIVLNLDTVAKGIEISAPEVTDWYEKHQDQYGKPEERRASHILITVAKDAKPEDKAAAKAKAQALLDEVRRSPKSFADVAKKNSQDPGSAASGGDLGFFGRGAMVKPFDDALFAMKVGDIEGPVETQYGFHVIRLDAIKPGEKTPLDKVRSEIEQELRKAKAGKAFVEAADTLQNTVYEQSDSLKPAADALKLVIQTSDWITRDGGGLPLLSKPEILGKIFSEDVIKNGRNTSAVEVAPNTIVAARVLEHRAADVLPFEEVRKDVQQQLFVERATKLVEEEGKAALAKLKGGDDKAVTWSPTVLVSLQKPSGLQPEAAREVFSADPTALPAYVGMPVSNGRYVIYRVGKVIDPPALGDDQRKALARQLAQIAAQQQFDAYLQTIRAGAGVEIDPAKVERKAQ
ncbi:MAG: SurA N-terminal domain-containing protein [Burkholderiales bacterium]|nr:SurA N-terminal domain-containing protein [Burkholderiales bacterium]